MSVVISQVRTIISDMAKKKNLTDGCKTDCGAARKHALLQVRVIMLRQGACKAALTVTDRGSA